MKENLLSKMRQRKQRFLRDCELYYDAEVTKIEKIIDFLNDKKFKYGQVVRIQSTGIERALNGEHTYAVIVGHSDLEDDNDRSYYRVYTDPRNQYMGADEDSLHALEEGEETPKALQSIPIGIYGSHEICTHTFITANK